MNCLEIIKILIPVVGAVLVALITYVFAVKKLKQESRINIERKKYEAILEAHKEIYALLAYITDTENPKSILVWTAPKGNKKDKTYYFVHENIQRFLGELPETFYGKTAGLFLSTNINQLLFEYRSIVYGLSLTIKTDDTKQQKIENPQIAQRMKAIHQELTIGLRDAINIQNRDLKNI